MLLFVLRMPASGNAGAKMYRRFVFWAAIALMSCSSSAGTGGSGVGGDSGVGATGGSGPTPPPAEGGVYIRIYPASSVPAGAACTRTTGHAATIPADTFPTAAGIGPSTQDSPGNPAIDGQNGAVVTCGVSGGDPYQVNGQMSLQSVSFAISGGSVPTQGNGTANIATFEPVGLSMQNPADAPCTVTAMQIQAGAVWATFRCARYEDPATPMQSACAAEGLFLLQNCDR
jgi:hypothetical protein